MFFCIWHTVSVPSTSALTNTLQWVKSTLGCIKTSIFRRQTCCPIMDVVALDDITGVTGQPCWGRKRRVRKRRRRRISPHKFTLPFAGDEIQPPHKPAASETTRDGGGNSASALKAAEFRIICGSWTVSCSASFCADSRLVRPQLSGPRSATPGGSEGNHIWSKYSLLSPSGTVRL